MDKKIIFFDIDGTILNEKTNEISLSTKNALTQAKENGHMIFINTGRTISYIPDCIKQLDFDGYVCGCGTYIELNNSEIFYKHFSKDFCKKVIDDLRTCTLDSILESKKAIYFDDVLYCEEISKIKFYSISQALFNIETFESENLIFDKLVIWVNPKSNFKYFYEKYKNIFNFIERSENFYELTPIGYSKASGIEFLLERLNIAFENSFAIGDSTNDLDMLKFVKNSIAMGNSNPCLFDLVSYITTDIDSDGIYNALKHYNII